MYIFFLSSETSALVGKVPGAISVSCSPQAFRGSAEAVLWFLSIVTVIEYLLSTHDELGVMLSTSHELILFIYLFLKIYLLIMLLQLSHFPPFTPSCTPLPSTFPHYSSCPWVIHIGSLASTFPILFLPSP